MHSMDSAPIGPLCPSSPPFGDMNTRTTHAHACVRTYARLFQMARFFGKQASEQTVGSAHFSTASVVFCAFTIEAMVNHFARERVLNWKKRERELGARKRLSLLLEALKLRPDMNQRPWSTIETLRGLRDELAHGRSRDLMAAVVDFEGPDTFAPRLLTTWEAASTPVTVNEYISDVREIADCVHEACGLPRDQLADLGGFGGVSSWA